MGRDGRTPSETLQHIQSTTLIPNQSHTGVPFRLLTFLLLVGSPVAAYVGFFGMWCAHRSKSEPWRHLHYPIGFLVYLEAISTLATASIYLQTNEKKQRGKPPYRTLKDLQRPLSSIRTSAALKTSFCWGNPGADVGRVALGSPHSASYHDDQGCD